MCAPSFVTNNSWAHFHYSGKNIYWAPRYLRPWDTSCPKLLETSSRETLLDWTSSASKYLDKSGFMTFLAVRQVRRQDLFFRGQCMVDRASQKQFGTFMMIAPSLALYCMFFWLKVSFFWKKCLGLEMSLGRKCRKSENVSRLDLSQLRTKVLVPDMYQGRTCLKVQDRRCPGLEVSRGHKFRAQSFLRS